MAKIDTSGWKEFLLGDLFDIQKGTGYGLKNLPEGKTPLISAKTTDNSIVAYANVKPRFPSKTITVTTDGAGMGFATVQDNEFDIASNAVALIPYEEKISVGAKFFVCAIIRKYAPHFSYSDKMNQGQLNKLKIKLPSTPSGDPDWTYMENYMKGIENNVLARLTALETAKDTEKKKIDTSQWKEFRVGDLFTQERGKESAPNQNDEGCCPLIKETSINNGFDRNVVPTSIINGNCITVSVNYASTVFYQPASFCASVNILVLRNPNLSMYSGLFISSILSTLHAKYDYTYKISKDRLNEEMIKLPATPFGDPDWAYMENYMKGIENKVRASADVLMR